MNNFNSKRLYLLFLIITISIFMSCGNILPLAKSCYHDAKDLRSDGKNLESIDKAIQAIVVQPEYKSAKKFVYKNWDKSISTAILELKSLEKTNNLQGAERMVYTYKILISIYDNLGKLQLPINYKDKWTWNTEIIDYKASFDKAIVHAHNLFFKVASEKVKRAELSESFVLFNRMYNNYTYEDQKVTTADSISFIYNQFAKSHEFSDMVGTVIDVYTAYGYSLKFNNEQSQIKIERCAAANRISFLYVVKATSMFNSTDLKELEQAVDYCKSALKWNRANSKAQPLMDKLNEKIYSIHFEKAVYLEKINTVESLKKSLDYYNLALGCKRGNPSATNRIVIVREKLAEKFYQAGLILDRQNAVAYKVIKNYKLAQKWVPNYKDTDRRIYVFTIIDEFNDFECNISNTFDENEKIRQNVACTSDMLGHVQYDLNKITLVSGKLRNLKVMMTSLQDVLMGFGTIPVVGVVANETNRSLDVSKRPITRILCRLNAIETSVVIPSKQVETRFRYLFGKVDREMVRMSRSLIKVQKSSYDMKDCLKGFNSIEDLRAVESQVKIVNGWLMKFNHKLRDMNNSINSTRGVIISFSEYAKTIKAVDNGINSVNYKLRSISSAAHSVRHVLNRKVGTRPERVSIKDVLNNSIDKYMSLAMAPLNPLINEIESPILSIQGLGAFSNGINMMEIQFKNLDDEHLKSKDNLYDLIRCQHQMEDEYNKMVDGFGFGFGTKI